MRPISRSSKRTIFRNEFLHLYSVSVEFPGRSKEYFVTEKGTRVGVLLLREDKALLVRQYRFLIDDYSWEIPGGGLNAGESAEQAIRRECKEEAGVECGSLVPLFNYLLGTDVSDNRVRLYYSTDFSDLGNGGDGQETDARIWVPLSDCLSRALSGGIQDLMTITALLVYDQKGRPQ